MESINQRIARYRKFAGYIQSDVAERLGMKHSTYSQKERKGNIDCKFLVDISLLLDVDIKILLFGGDTPLPKAASLALTPKEITHITTLRNLPPDKRNAIYKSAYQCLKNK